MATLLPIWTKQLRRFDTTISPDDLSFVLSLVTVCTVYFLVSNRCDLGSNYSTLVLEVRVLQLRALIHDLVISFETSIRYDTTNDIAREHNRVSPVLIDSVPSGYGCVHIRPCDT